MNLKTYIIGDLTALYAVRSRYRKTINYHLLDEVLKEQIDIEQWDSSCWFTLFNNRNEGQASFLEGLEEMGWNIERISSKNLKTSPINFRFDPHISYEIGASNDDHIVVVSDSFNIFYAMQKLNKMEPEVKLTLAFFSDALDNRWMKELYNSKRFINFIDLEQYL